MPRTKVSKSKRTRDAIAKDEKVRNFEKTLEEFQYNLDTLGTQSITAIEYMIDIIKDSATASVLNMRFVDFQKINFSKFRDYSTILESSKSQKKPNDDGYITEESGNSASSSAFNAVLSMAQQRGRTPAALSSALARQNSRRSKSACNGRSILVPKQSQAVNRSSSRTSRNRLRTPMGRSKAVSADRSIMVKKPENDSQSPPAAFLRWPKPGEFIMSVHGTPLNAHIAPDRFANVNIPIKDGVLSLRPKKLENIDVNLMQNIDTETLNQIKTLHQNLEMIVRMTDRACNNNK